MPLSLCTCEKRLLSLPGLAGMHILTFTSWQRTGNLITVCPCVNCWWFGKYITYHLSSDCAHDMIHSNCSSTSLGHPSLCHLHCRGLGLAQVPLPISSIMTALPSTRRYATLAGLLARVHNKERHGSANTACLIKQCTPRSLEHRGQLSRRLRAALEQSLCTQLGRSTCSEGQPPQSSEFS